MVKGKITEWSLYPAIKNVFNRAGAKVVVEMKYKTRPDFVIDWLGDKWIVSVKIGNVSNSRLVREAFLQFDKHRLESKIGRGIILFFPEEIRKIKPIEEEIENAVEISQIYALVFNPHDEIRDTLEGILMDIRRSIIKKVEGAYSLDTVIRLLKDHIEDMMSNIRLSEDKIAQIITDQELFFGISHKEEKGEDVFKFLATYIFLSQVLFFKLYSDKHPVIIEDVDISKVDRETAKKLFERILKINYRPIFGINVLDIIPNEYISNTFRLIWALRVEKVRYELPGRLFHSLMPQKIRKLLAAFYTRPIAADLLATLTIDDPDVTVFDPACGSGTLLTAAYKRKLKLWEQKKRDKKNPHRLFCEQQIFGGDIMPFAVQLTAANLAAMDPGETIRRVQIVLGNSLELTPSEVIPSGYRSILEYMKSVPSNMGVANSVDVTNGGEAKVTLRTVDVVIMNPPFTKMERRIKDYVKIPEEFRRKAGGEVGLWGHFIVLADKFLKEGGIFGGVIPINLLRGRESARVRRLVFKEWLPLYIVKATRNYGFSEWSEYRDILIIAKKTKEKPKDHKVKFALIKRDLNELTEKEIEKIADLIKTTNTLESNLVDIESYPLQVVEKNIDNLMPFISGVSSSDRNSLKKIVKKVEKVLCNFPENYFREAYRPVPKGVSKFMFITRPLNQGRIKEAFLILKDETPSQLIATTPLGMKTFKFDKRHFVPSLRTAVGVGTIDITGKYDYVAKEKYNQIQEVMNLSGFKGNLPTGFWSNVQKELKAVKTKTVIVRKINPFAPNQHLIAFYSEVAISPSNQLNVIKEPDPDVGKAVTVLLNSVFFLAYFFLNKQETTGRYIDIRFYDLYAMKLYPCNKEQVKKLVEVYNRFGNEKFPALSKQLDRFFEERYKEFWRKERHKKQKVIPEIIKVGKGDIEPHPLRLEFDRAVADAIGLNLTEEDLLAAYKAIVNDMIITRGLRKD